MFAKGLYTFEAERPVYIIEFSGHPVFDLSSEEIGQEQAWGMFTHGICAVVVCNHLRFHRLAIRADQMNDLGEKGLMERLERACDVLRYMSETMAAYNPFSLTARQCSLASEILALQQESLVAAMIRSQRLMEKSKQSADE